MPYSYSYKSYHGYQMYILILIYSLFLTGCKNSDDAVVMPSDLSIQVEIAENNSGDVRVVFSSRNTAYYKVFFGIPGENAGKITDNHVNYKYAQPGNYTITVQAHNDETHFITATEEVSIQVIKNDEIPTSGYTSPEHYEGMVLVWQDEFEGDMLNQNDWSFEIGTGSNGWGNNELQYYREENTEVKDGYLIISAKKEAFQGRNYTSSRIITKDKQDFQYGRIDIRAVTPKGQGIWPALWMLGSNFSTVGWPACGEIDIMEMIGGTGKDNVVHGTVHWDNNGQHASYGGHYTKPNGIFADEFHVFSIIWNETSITWLIDDVQFHVIDITPAGLSEFRQNFFFIFNVAVGGNWPGSPDAQTSFPQKMIVDYIRVFQ